MAQLPETSRVMIKLAPSNQWQWEHILLNNIYHQLRILSWQNTKDATVDNPQHYPEFWTPTFIPKPKPPKTGDGVAMDVDELQDFLSKPRQSVKVESNE